MAHRFIWPVSRFARQPRKADVGRHALLLAAQYGKSIGPCRGPLRYVEYGTGTAEIMPLDAAAYGDVVLARKDVPTSYHLAVVVDDAAQNISQVTRGRDLQSATAIHVLLQKLLGLPQPDYLHHGLRGLKRAALSNRQAIAAFAICAKRAWVLMRCWLCCRRHSGPGLRPRST